MQKMLYCKFSDERDARFNIITEVVEAEDGRQYVVKKPCTEQAAIHVSQILNNGDKLNEKYHNTQLEFAHSWMENNNVCIDLIQGKKFKTYINALFEKGNSQRALEYIRDYVKVVQESADIDFVVTPEFINVFGNVTIPNGVKASKINDVDMVLDNIILSEEKYIDIDFEWTFAFPVPVNYIIYRVLLYSWVDSWSEFITPDDIWNEFGITDEQIEAYTKMEYGFQAYVSGNEKTTWAMYQKIGKDIYPIERIVNEIENAKRVTVYLETEQGYEELKLAGHNFWIKNGDIRLRIPVNNSVKTIRIDPAISNSIVKIDYIKNADNQKNVAYDTNGEKIEDDLYWLKESEPHITIPRQGDIHEIDVALRLIFPGVGGEENINILCNRINALKNIITEQAQVISNSTVDYQALAIAHNELVEKYHVLEQGYQERYK